MATNISKSESSKPADRKFKIARGQVGPWSKGQVFALSTFKDLHPIYESTRPRPKGFDGARYHDGLIDRLLDLKCIEEVQADAMESEIAPGPLAQPQEKFEDHNAKHLTRGLAEALKETVREVVSAGKLA